MNTADRLPGLDLLRGIAIVWVMLFHSWVVGGLGPDWSWLSRYGWMGVDLFFVLSGFLIGTQVFTPMSLGRRLSFGDFYIRRAFRILPAYLVTLALYLLWPSFREADGLESPWKFITFTMNLNIDYTRNSAFSHAWSLCVEEHFYWFFPLIAVGLRRRPASWKFLLLFAGLILGGIAIRAAIWLHGMEVDPKMNRNWFIEDIYYPTWNRLDGLVFGVALAAWKAFRSQSWLAAGRYANLSLIAGILVVALSFLLFSDRTGLLGNAIGWPILSLGLALLVFAGAARGSVIGGRSLPIFGWLAATSYSLYLTHKAAYHLVQQFWGAQLVGAGLIAFAAYATAAILLGAALHYSVERPLLKSRLRFTRTSAEAQLRRVT